MGDWVIRTSSSSLDSDLTQSRKDAKNGRFKVDAIHGHVRLSPLTKLRIVGAGFVG